MHLLKVYTFVHGIHCLSIISYYLDHNCCFLFDINFVYTRVGFLGESPRFNPPVTILVFVDKLQCTKFYTYVHTSICTNFFFCLFFSL